MHTVHEFEEPLGESYGNFPCNSFFVPIIALYCPYPSQIEHTNPSNIKFVWQNNTLSVIAPTCKFKILRLWYKLLPQNNKGTNFVLTLNFQRECISVYSFLTSFVSLLREVGKPTLPYRSYILSSMQVSIIHTDV